MPNTYYLLKILNILLKPFIELASPLLGWIAWRGIKKWARTPQLFDTEPKKDEGKDHQ